MDESDEDVHICPRTFRMDVTAFPCASLMTICSFNCTANITLQILLLFNTFWLTIWKIWMQPFSNPTYNCSWSGDILRTAVLISILSRSFFCKEMRWEGDGILFRITDEMDQHRRFPSWWLLIIIRRACVMQRTGADCPFAETTIWFLFETISRWRSSGRKVNANLRFRTTNMDGMIRTCWPQFLRRFHKHHTRNHPVPWMSLKGMNQLPLKRQRNNS